MILSRYDREVGLMVARDRVDHKRFYYMVPEQEGTPGGVEWDDPRASETLGILGRYVGSLHVHPGNSAEPSGTDVEQWAEPGNQGFHYVFGRGGSFTLHGAVRSRVFPLAQGSIRRWPKGKLPPVYTSGNRSLETLLKVPPSQVITVGGDRIAGRLLRLGKQQRRVRKGVPQRKPGTPRISKETPLLWVEDLRDLRFIRFGEDYLVTSPEGAEQLGWPTLCPAAMTIRPTPKEGSGGGEAV
jgi:hypothetical protein